MVVGNARVAVPGAAILIAGAVGTLVPGRMNSPLQLFVIIASVLAPPNSTLIAGALWMLVHG
jgi:hypothetical protein